MTNATIERPLVTFALFAYNQEKYIREAVEGAFSQTYEPMEVILSDDCSTDRTFEIMQQMAAAYDGPHKVSVRRNEANLGLAGHVNAAFIVAGGDILLLAAGDDISLPDRTTISVELLDSDQNATAVLLSADIIDHSGKIIGERLANRRKNRKYNQSIHDLLNWNHVTSGATRAIRRNVFWKFGLIKTECPTEDTPLLLRSLMCGENIVSPKKGILYRRHENNLSSSASLNGMDKEAIYNQYKTDIEFAEETLLISSKLRKMLNKWMLTDMKVRSIRLKVSQNANLRIRECVFYMWHPSSSIRDKIKFFLKYFLPHKVFRWLNQKQL